MKFLKWLYYALATVLILFALLLIVSVFPIPGNIKTLVVLSGSMEPAIHTGSVVIVKPSAGYAVGDIVTFGNISKTSIPTTHRIAEISMQAGQPVYITKGDANNSNDQKSITNKDIAGKVYFSVPYAGYALSAARKPEGFVLLVILPVAIVIFDESRKIFTQAAMLKRKKQAASSNGQPESTAADSEKKD